MDICSEEYMDNEFIKDNFFLISNENFHEIDNKLYGYVLNGNCLFINNLPKDRCINKHDFGYYINIINNQDELLIHSDYYGLFSLFVYSSGDNFAVSNSLLLLINYLRKKKYKLTINKDYISTFLWTWTSLNFKKTCAEEIEHLPHFYLIRIDKIKKSIEKVKLHQPRQQINLESKKGMDLIDAWHDRWHNVISSFCSNNFDFHVDITGGKDSRAAIAPLFCQNKCDTDQKINFYCIENYDPHDTNTANEIGRQLNFEVSTRAINDYRYISLFQSLANSFLSKMTSHSLLTSYYSWCEPVHLAWGGSGGELLRSHWHFPPELLIHSLFPFYPYLKQKPEAVVDVMEMFTDSFSNILKEYKASNGMTMAMYECVRMRCHFGLCGFESYLSNRVCISPLLDPELSKLKLTSAINKDQNLLFTLIYDRFMSKIRDIKFNHNVTLKPETVYLAERLNKICPYIKKDANKTDIYMAERKKPFFASQQPDLLRFFNKIFFSPNFKKIIASIFGEDVYLECYDKIKNDNFFTSEYVSMNTNVTALISVYLAVIAVNPELAENKCDEMFKRLLELNVSKK